MILLFVTAYSVVQIAIKHLISNTIVAKSAINDVNKYKPPMKLLEDAVLLNISTAFK